MKKRKIISVGGLLLLLTVILFSKPVNVQAVPLWPLWDGDLETNWEEVTTPHTNAAQATTELYNPDNRIMINKVAPAYVSTTMSPGGRKVATGAISEQQYFTRRRTDVPLFRFKPRAVGSSLNTTYKMATLGRDTLVNGSPYQAQTWDLNLKSLGLVFAVGNDSSTLQEVTGGRIVDNNSNRVTDLSPLEPNIDFSTFKVFRKEVSKLGPVNSATAEAYKYIYEMTIKDKQGVSYRVQVDQTYFPSKDGQIRISFDFKNIGDKTIPQLMIGYNYTPEVNFRDYLPTNLPTGVDTAGKVKYLGKNLGVYTVDSTGMYRGEIYPSIDKFGADNWTAWAEPFVGTTGYGSRDISVFMKGFDDPNDFFSTGQENKGIAKDTVINDEPKRAGSVVAEGGTDTTISMKWSPQDLKVNETRNTAWIYGSEIIDITPRLTLTEDERKYTVPDGEKANAILRGTWRSYMAESGTIKYTIDDGEQQLFPVKYATAEDIGGVETFEIPLKFKPTADHTVKIFLEDDAGNQNEIQSVIYSFEYPEPKIAGTSSIKVNNLDSNKIAIGGEFVYNMDLVMEAPYSKLFGNKVSIPINTAIVDPASLKAMTISDGKKVVNGVYDAASKSLNFTFDNEITEKDKLHVQFTGKIIDSEALIGQTLDIIPSEVVGKSGLSTSFKAFSMPADELPQATATIISKISTINVSYLIEGTTTALGELEAPKEGLTGSKGTILSKAFDGYLLSKVMIDGVEQKPLIDPVPVEYGAMDEVIFYYQVKPILTADLAISKPEIMEGEKVTFTSTFKNTAIAPSDITNARYKTIEAFPKNVEVVLESVKLNDQPLAESAVTLDETGKLNVTLGELKPEVEYKLTYDVISKIATPPLNTALEVKQAYTLTGKSADTSIVEANSGELKSFVITPRIADITVLHLEEGTDAEIAHEEPRQGIIGEETTFTAKPIDGYVLSKVVVDDEEQPLSNSVKVKYGEQYLVEFYYTGILELKSAPKSFDFGKSVSSYNKIRVGANTVTGDPLVITDNRLGNKDWSLKATLKTPLSNASGKILADAVRYQDGDEETVLTEGALPIVTRNTAKIGDYNVSDSWSADSTGNGFKLEIAPGAVSELGSYHAEILFQLGITP